MQTQLVTLSGSGQAVTSSNKVAEVFGKNHQHVLRNIRDILEQDLTVQNWTVKEWFYESEYLNDRNQKQPCYFMNQQAFSLLAMGFTGKRAMQFKIHFIQEFERMKAYILSQQNGDLQELKQKVEQLQIHANLQISAGYYQVDLSEYTVIGFAASRGFKFNNSTAIMYGKKAASLSKKKGAKIGKIKDPRFGFVNTYQTSILKEVFSQPIF